MRRLAAVAALLAVPARAGGLYTKRSPVIQVDSSNYDQVILDSNHTSIVEFYAPWCGHCQNLKPEYEKAAEALAGLAKVAAVNCDDDKNKQFCTSMGIQGFPTIKIVRPSMNRNSRKRDSKPSIEDYNGQRSAPHIFSAVKDSINNHVIRVSDKNLDAFLAGDKPKALLFTDKGTTSALLRSIAIDFLDVISVGQIRDKETAAVEKFGIEKFPALVLLPGEAKEPVVYTAAFNKKEMVDFLSQAGPPNPEAAPNAKAKDNKAKSAKEKKTKSKNEKEKKEKSRDDKDKSESKRPSKAEPESESESSTTASATPAPDVISIATVSSMDTLVDKCLRPKSHTCVLALVPSPASEQGDKVVASLSQLNTKYLHGKRHLFPFFSVPSDVEGISSLRDALKLSADVELIVVNGRRAWWRRYEGNFGVESVEDWIDAIRMGEGKKNDLPSGVVVEGETAEKSTKATESEPTEKKASEASESSETEATEATAKSGKAKETESSDESATAAEATKSTEKPEKAKSSESESSEATDAESSEATDAESSEATDAESSEATDAESKTESDAQEESAKATEKVVHEEL